MLSKRIKKVLAFRFYIMKLCGCSAFHWDYKQDQLVLSGRFNYFIWLALLYIAAIVLVPTMGLMLQKYVDPQNHATNFYEVGTGKKINRRLVIFFAVLITCIGIYSCLTATVIKEKREQMKNLYGAIWELDKTFAGIFK